VKRPVLVTDDDRDFRDTLREILELEGYPVETAAHGGEALEKMRRAPPGLVLLDLSMPGVDGLEVCQRRAADPALARIPLVVVSAVHQLDERFRSLGIDGYIDKPIRIEDLLELVRRHCG